MKKEWEDAINNGNADQVSALLNAGTDINAKDHHGQTGLMNAAIKGYTEIVWLLANRSANLNHTAKYGLSALMLAVINNHPDIVSELLKAGADVTLRGKPENSHYDKTALELANKLGYVRCHEILRSELE